jgi:hypothetical protein
MTTTKCFDAHEIHLGILAANEEFRRRHARPRVGQEEETEFFALVAAAVKLNRTFDALDRAGLPHALSDIRAAHPEYQRFLDDGAIMTLIGAWRNKPPGYDAELNEKATRSLRLDGDTCRSLTYQYLNAEETATAI